MNTIEIQEVVDEVVKDLKDKIADISQYADTVDEKHKSEANGLRNVAISVLTKAGNKLQEQAMHISDVKDFIEGLEIIKNKSQDLYDDIVTRISAFNDESGVRHSMFQMKKEPIVVPKIEKDDFANLYKNAQSRISKTVKAQTAGFETKKKEIKPGDISNQVVDKLNRWFKSGE